VFILTHEDVEDVAKARGQIESLIPKITTALVAVGVLAGPQVALVVAIVVAYLAAEGLALKVMDQGNGVYLTIPWTAIPGGQYWLIIPTAYPPRGDADWLAGLDDGHLRTEDEDDDIHFVVQHDVVERQGAVAFILVNNTGSDKRINMPDGLGASWNIVAEDGGGSAENGLSEADCKNGQALTFSNHIAFGFWDDVLPLGGLERLKMNDVVTFYWDKD
jgi:hypothetical protein